MKTVFDIVMLVAASFFLCAGGFFCSFLMMSRNGQARIIRLILGVGRGKVRCPCCGKWMGHTKVLKPKKIITPSSFMQDFILPPGSTITFEKSVPSSAGHLSDGQEFFQSCIKCGRDYKNGVAQCSCSGVPSVDSGWSGFVADAEKPAVDAGADPFAIPELKTDKEEKK